MGKPNEAHLKNPVFNEWRDLLNWLKRKYLPAVATGWVTVLFAVGLTGSVYPVKANGKFLLATIPDTSLYCSSDGHFYKNSLIGCSLVYAPHCLVYLVRYLSIR